jgi:hypothetical protein
MIFKRTYKFTSSQPADEIRKKLIGKHTQVHKLDFEITDQDKFLRIIPHAEDIDSLKTLPITHVELSQAGSNTKVTVFGKIRKIDEGGPTIIVVFCVVMLLLGGAFYFFGGPSYVQTALILVGISVLLFAIFWAKMEAGYFDYIRKIRDFVKQQAGAN